MSGVDDRFSECMRKLDGIKDQVTDLRRYEARSARIVISLVLALPVIGFVMMIIFLPLVRP